MKLTKCKLGELITQRREKNDGSDLPICGVSKDGLIPPKQKDADTSIYNVFYRDDFIFNPARMELNSIAINDMYNRAICSSLYEVFYVHRTDLLLPHYLKLIIRQKWFTRYCEFLGQGSAREYCRFGNISEIEIEFPPIEEQQKIVDYNTAIENRIALKQKINDNLDATIYAKFQDMFQKNKEILFSGEQLEDWCIKPLSFLADFKYGKMATSEILCEKGFPVYSGYRIVGYCNKYMFKEPQLVVLARGVSGTGEVRISPPCCHLTNLSIAVLLYDRTYINYLLYYLENDNLISLDSGSAQSQITINDLSMHKVMLPPYSKVVEFDNISKQLRSIIDENNKEIEVLEELKKVLLTTILSR